MQLEHEITRKSFFVSTDCQIQITGRDLVKDRQIGIE